MWKVTLVALLLVGVCSAVDVPENYVFDDPPNEGKDSRVKRQADVEWENSVCQCVPYYQCNADGSMNKNGLGIIDIRAGLVGTVDNPVLKRRKCTDHFLDVCCIETELIKSVGQGDQGSQGGQDGQSGQGGVVGKSHYSKGCGYRNANGIGFRITGNNNNEANFAEFPWMVAVLKRSDVQGKSMNVYQCGGSLIHKRVVLTAAHCVEGALASDITIRAGEWDTQTASEPIPHQNRQASVIISHPGYEKDILYNDFALIILEQPLDLADNVEVVCLPEANEVFDYSKCFATGWGKDNFGEEGAYQVILKAIELPIVPHEQCQTALRTTRLGKYFNLHNTFMCAGGVQGLDTCTGDGGSPLVCPLRQDPTRYTQAGIVAWGIGCGTEIPGVYADVTKARPWIEQVLSSYNIDNLSYTPGANPNFSQ